MPPDKFTYNFIVKPNKPCWKAFKSAQYAMLKDIIYQEDAKHGKVLLRQSGAFYTANQNYHGKDSFVLRLCATVRETYGCADFQFLVTVE